MENLKIGLEFGLSFIYACERSHAKVQNLADSTDSKKISFWPTFTMM